MEKVPTWARQEMPGLLKGLQNVYPSTLTNDPVLSVEILPYRKTLRNTQPALEFKLKGVPTAGLLTRE